MKDLKVVFAPGCFDDFEGTQEELNELMAEIKNMAQSGELFDNMTPATMEDMEEMAAREKNIRQ